MLNTTGERIRQLRKSKGLTQEALAKIIGTQKAAINKYETGIVVNLKRSVIEKLAKALDTTPLYLLGYVIDINVYAGTVPLPRTKAIPLLGVIACGGPILTEDNFEGWVLLDEGIKADFALRCKGASMINARIYDGDLVCIRQQPAVENGEIAAVLVDGEVTLKRVYTYPNRIELRPENPLFPVLNYEAEGLQAVAILGKAVVLQGMIR
ncbi:MAG: S24 family peptidase [Eubacteriales bacterium]|nr:S24 family peptidase [Eubacteriales bacterium]